jgi:hypothetical protein
MKMAKSGHIKAIILFTTLFCMLFVLCAYAQVMYEKKHPVEVEVAICSQCHADKWPDMDHTQRWDVSHKFSASRAGQVCNICHKESFCTDCHGNKEEIKPSDKYKDFPERSLPHRGDYLTQHRIDGKINPAPCFRCHGRQNNRKCRICHR